MTNLARRWRSLMLAGGLILVALAILTGSLSAQESGDRGQGWTVWHGNEKTVYQFENQWRGEPTANGFQLKNDRTGVEHFYYGTFQVEHRKR